jgi:hypothetical protein
VDTVVRLAGACWIAAGVLFLAELSHPNALDIGFAEASEQSTWPALHVALVLAGILTVLGLAGLVARFGSELGRLGIVGAVLTVPGIVVAAGLFLTEAFLFPGLAREDPGLLDLGGPLLGSLGLRFTGALAGLWFLGLVLVGLAVERAHVLPRGAGILLAVGTVLFAALEGPFLPVAGKVAVVLYAAAHIRFGLGLASVRSTTGTPALRE